MHVRVGVWACVRACVCTCIVHVRMCVCEREKEGEIDDLTFSFLIFNYFFLTNAILFQVIPSLFYHIAPSKKVLLNTGAYSVLNG